MGKQVRRLDMHCCWTSSNAAQKNFAMGQLFLPQLKRCAYYLSDWRCMYRFCAI